jgi:hypothetical protein
MGEGPGMVRASAEDFAPAHQLLGLLGESCALEMDLLKLWPALASLEDQGEPVQDLDDLKSAGWLLIQIPTERAKKPLVGNLLT